MNRTGPAPHTSRPLGGLVAPIADAVCFVAFVFFGRDQHGIHGGLSWFLTVLWPLLVGWFVLALAIRLYTWVAGVLLGLVLRQLLTSHGDSFSTFTVVVLVFTGLTTFGWRAVLIGVRRASRGRGTRVPEAA
jgi:hypothetical protein